MALIWSLLIRAWSLGPLWSRLRRSLIALALIGLVFGLGYWRGVSSSELNAMARENARLAQAIEIASQAAQAASVRAVERAEQLARYQETIDAYANELLDDAGDCALDQRDLDRLRGL